ncbi:MAG: sialate O-acetylesterase [Pseudomonadota bacterium]|nr:sialate O-acetylesterase [Pseudomonadota bacterium]
MPRLLATALLVALSTGATIALEPATLLDGPFGDHMVLQRGEPVRLRGHARPGETVAIRFDGHESVTRAGPEGAWQAALPAHAAGGPFDMTIETASGETQTLSDVLVGDVWLCSGQSNMEYPVSRALNPHSEIPAARNETIRLLTIPQTSRPRPQARLPNAADWRAVTPETVADFSAVCYFFARTLQESEPVPMGLIDASWGGSQIEAWIGAERLRALGGFDNALDLVERHAADPAAAQAGFGESWEAWWRGTQGNEPWRDPGGDWRPVPALTDWQSWDDPQIRGHLGMVWYRTTVELTAEQAASPARLEIGIVDEIDASWVNGRFLGSTSSWSEPRRYTVPPRLLQAGENTITVNALNGWGAGGMTGPAGSLRIAFEDAPDAALETGWHYRVVPAGAGTPPRAPWESVSGLTGLHNAMIAPLGPIGLRGALWYQGESNADRAEAYRPLLETLLDGWRDQFGAGLPVLIVQLPGFGALQSAPAPSGWARIREAQRRVAAGDPETALVVTIDIGDRFDIHPPNKQAVGRRAARAARSLVFGADIAPSGPAPLSATRDGDSIRIRFGETGGGLAVIGDDRPAAFQLCTPGGDCRYADTASLDNDTVRLAPGDEAGRVRFCWADAPVCNLYDATGYPVGPFEIEVSGARED